MKTFADQALEISEKATSGPWQVDTNHSCIREAGDPQIKYRRGIQIEGYGRLDDESFIVKDQKENLEFIAYSREALPELARRLKRAIEQLRDAADDLVKNGGMDNCASAKFHLEIALELEKPMGEM